LLFNFPHNLIGFNKLYIKCRNKYFAHHHPDLDPQEADIVGQLELEDDQVEEEDPRGVHHVADEGDHRVDVQLPLELASLLCHGASALLFLLAVQSVVPPEYDNDGHIYPQTDHHEQDAGDGGDEQVVDLLT
jgi:hypothetical protein